MFKVLFRSFLLCICTLAFNSVQSQTLIINEVSNGASGTSEEYVELLVAGTPSCNLIPTMDIRNYYIDDNNGDHSVSTSGSGIAAGCVRFKNIPFWSNIPIGTLILIYNDAEYNPSIIGTVSTPTLDVSMSDGNCRLIIPINDCNYFERSTTAPSASSPLYPTTMGCTGTGNWTTVGMANGDDSFHTVDASGNIIFSVSWGNNTLNNNIYYSGNQSGQVIYMNNSLSNVYTLQGNWTNTVVTGAETPGAPNNAANAAWINSMNNSCSALSPFNISSTVTNATCSGAGSATITATGAIAPYTYTWSPSGGNNSSATGLTAGIYTINATSSNGCLQTSTLSISSSSNAASLSVNSSSICSGESATLTVSGASSYTWSTGANTSSIIVNPATTTNYTVSGTNLSCTGTATANVFVNSSLSLTVNSPTVCSGQTTTLTANGATSYTWNNGANTSNIVITPTTTSVYTVTGSDLTCFKTATTSVNVDSLPNLSINSSSICVGQTTTLTVSGADSYAWSTGATTTSVSVSPVNTTTYGVVGTFTTTNCFNTQTVSINVNPIPTLVVNSPTICAGQTATLIASGVSAYAWSTGAITDSAYVAPVSLSVYTITGTSAAGCSKTQTTSVSVTSLPVLTVNSPTLCAGQSTTVTANGATTYSWNTGATTNSLSLNAITATTDYTVVGITNGCSNTSTTTVTVLSLPIISVTSSSICAGETATLTANGTSSYLWNTGASTNSITVSPSSTIDYTVTGTALGCSNTATTSVYVTPLPTVTVNSSTICTGQTATLTANGATTYSWSNGATSNSVALSPNISTDYTVTGTSLGCSLTQTTSIGVTIQPTITVNSPTICTGTSTVLTASGANSYTWNTGATTNTLSVTPGTSTTYTVLGTIGGCGSFYNAPVVVNSIPVVSVASTTICAGETATLTANGALGYLWSNGSNSNPLQVSPSFSSNYTVTGTSNGCSSTNTCSVFVKNSPVVNFNSSAASGCATVCINFTGIASVIGGTITSWNWSFGNGDVSTVQNPNYCFNDPGTYTINLQVVADNGCVNSITANNAIQVFDIPNAQFSTNYEETDILNSDIQFYNHSTNATSYSWSFGDTDQSSDSNPSHYYTSEGVYTATLVATNQHGCTDITVKDIVINGVFTFYVPNAFTPNGDDINEVFMPIGSGWDKTSYNLYIHDRWGKLCFSSKDIAKGWDGRINDGEETAEVGAYTWKVELKDMFGKSHKFVGHVLLLGNSSITP